MKLYILFLLLIANNFLSQTSVEKEVQILLDKSNEEFKEIKIIASLKSANEALRISKKNKYSEGITKSDICIAKSLLEIGLYKQGLNYLKLAEKQPYFKTSIKFSVDVARLKGRAYGGLKMYKLSVQEFRKQLFFSNKLSDTAERNLFTFWGYQNLSAVFEMQNQRDSVSKYLKLQEKVLRRFNKKDAGLMLSTTYVQNAEDKIGRKDFLNARLYLDSSLALVKKYNINYLYYTLEGMGDLERALGNKEKAVDYYEKALENALEINDLGARNELYKVLGDYLTENHMDIDKANTYLYYYQKAHDSIENEHKNAVEFALDEILNKNERDHEEKIRQYIYMIVSISVSVFGLLFACFYYSKRRKSELLIKEKQKVIEENENLKINLGETNNKKIEELVTLAQNNSPEFLILFKELYPDFISKLTALDPHIKSSEVLFCAFAYLNFSTKEISQYTFVTVRAVQIRRNRLRKKYNISSDIDFNHWMHNLSIQNEYLQDPIDTDTDEG